MVKIIEPLTLVSVSLFVFSCSLTAFNTFMPLSLILSMLSRLCSLALFVSKLKVTDVTTFFNKRIHSWFGMLTFFHNKLNSLSMFEIIFKLTLVINTFGSRLFSISLSFASNKITFITPKRFVADCMNEIASSILYTILYLTFINVCCLSINFSNHHPFIINTLIICVICRLMNCNLILILLTINDKFKTCHIFYELNEILFFYFRFDQYQCESIIYIFNGSLFPKLNCLNNNS